MGALRLLFAKGGQIRDIIRDGVIPINREEKFAMNISARKMLRRALPVLTAALVLVVGISLASPSPTEASKGQELFKGKCAGCHGPDGKGQTSMGKMLKLKDLGSAEVQKLSDAELHDTIAKGKKPMPAYEGQLKKEQIDDLVAYLRDLGKKEKK
jgi:mono/diheme cytochrome c family protein